MTTVDEFAHKRDGAAIGVLAADAGATSRLRYSLPEAGALVREVRGTKMRTIAALFDEFAAAFQFPYYFGANKDAFDEVMRELDEFVGVAAGYVVVVRDADDLLADDPDQLDWFTDSMRFYAEHWGESAVAFRVVLQSSSSSRFGRVATLSL